MNEKRREQPHAQRMREICRYIEFHHDDRPPSLSQLAERAGMSSYHFLRTFRSVVGVTPKKYGDALRLARLKSGLKEARKVSDAVLDAGFASPSGVYEHVDTRLGMTPKEYRAGGDGVSISHVVITTFLGPMMIGATDRGICFVQFAESAGALLDALRREYPKAELQVMESTEDPELKKWILALTRHLEGRQPILDLPLDIRATAFQTRVWTYLQSIPYGEVASYSEVAAAIGSPKAVRAVARACASNTVAIVIPCHRVIRGTGEMAGYRWGLERKRRLVDRERSVRRGPPTP